MNFAQPQFLLALPEIVLLGMICLVLLTDVFLPERYRYLTFYFTQLTLLLAFIVVLPQFSDDAKPMIAFSGSYVVDKLAVLSKLVIYLFSAFAFAYARSYIALRQIARSEYYILGLFSVLGMSIMVSAYNLLTIYLGLELLSLALYAMVAMYKESGDATEAAMKYFVLGSLASGVLLYGISILYGLTGSIQIDEIAHLLQTHTEIVPILALIFIMAGLIFKFGAVPFHMWVPDVYQGAATPVTLFIASTPKVAAFAVVIRILVQAMPSLQTDWVHILIVIAILSMFLGNVLAIAQSNLKRMLAYSSISHIGYTFLGVIAGPYSSQGYSAAMFYIATYVIMAAGAFAIITLMSRDGLDLDQVEDYRGLNARNPWLAFMMLLILFSMAGVPPTVGFLAKLGLLEALVQAQYVWLAVLTLIFSLIGAYYYLRVVMIMYFEEPKEGVSSLPLALSGGMRVAITINGSAALLLGLLPSYFIDLCRITVG